MVYRAMALAVTILAVGAPCVTCAQQVNNVRMGGFQPVTATDISTGTVSGRVLDPNGNPVADASVKITFLTEAQVVQPPALAGTNTTTRIRPRMPVQNGASAVTDSEGRFVRDKMPASAQALVGVHCPGYAILQQPIELPMENLELKLRKPYTKAVGRVLNAMDGSPVEGATITFSPQMFPKPFDHGNSANLNGMIAMGAVQLKLETDAHGRYETNELPEGRVLLDAMKEELISFPVYEGRSNSAEISADGVTEIPDIYLYPGHILAGQVRDATTNHPIAGVTIERMGGGAVRHLAGNRVQPVLTDENGHYRLEGLQPARYSGDEWGLSRIYASKAGYLKETATARFSPLSTETLVIRHDFALKPQP